MPGDILRDSSPVVTLLLSDTDSATLNGSSAGDDDIVLTNFTIELYQDGELVEDVIANLEAAPYNLGIDNVDNGKYKLHFDLPNPGFWEIWVQHSGDMVAWQKEQIDFKRTLNKLVGGSDENVSYEFVLAAVDVGAPRNVKAGLLDQLVVKVKDPDAADWSSPIRTNTLFYHYAASGDTEPTKIAEGP